MEKGKISKQDEKIRIKIGVWMYSYQTKRFRLKLDAFGFLDNKKISPT